MSIEDKLQVTLERGVKRITFNRPERRNAIDFEMFEAFAEAVERTATDGTRVVVISGAGDAFCSGLDLSSVAAGHLRADLHHRRADAGRRQHLLPLAPPRPGQSLRVDGDGRAPLGRGGAAS